MIFVCSQKISGSTDILMEIFEKRNISAFRFNLDMFDSYQFNWHNDKFQIIDPTGRICHSNQIDSMIFFKGWICSWFDFSDRPQYIQEKDYLISWLNRLYDCLMCYGKQHNLIRLWQPHGMGYAKTLQMQIAKKYFQVPDFQLTWGTQLNSKQVVAKTLTQRPLSNGEMAYVKIVDQADLDTDYPWFIQDVAPGNRDATILYINGKVHCFQFAIERGEITDWRTTQGTDENKWIPWAAGKDFERKIDLYMQELNLKYGRLDFIIGDDEPQFLEVNPEGQFGWLDDAKTLYLHNEIVDAILDPTTLISI